MGLTSEVLEAVRRTIKERESYDLVKANQLNSEEFEIAYSDSYSIREAREAVQEGWPMLAFLKAGPQLVIGESKECLAFKGAGDEAPLLVADTELAKSQWTGKGIIFLGRRNQIQSTVSPENEMVIFRPELDTWTSGLENKDHAKRCLMRLGTLPPNILPAHPVICIFKEADEKEKKENVRGFQAGASMYILDKGDTLPPCFHELGHFYWRTRLTEYEREYIKSLYDKIDKKNPPVIFGSNWSLKNPEEMFCTVYMWYMLSLLVHPGYRKIIKVEYPQGIDLIERVTGRIDTIEDEVNRYQHGERSLNSYIDRLMGKALAVKAGNTLIKADKLPLKPPEANSIPIDYREILGATKDREWVRITKGLLKGRVIVLQDGIPDFEYMQNHKVFWRVPGRRKTGG